ncbi:hypothetical protein HPP92_015893 [Vanilla planifolia]|uniref:tryptophan synthase n=1 Tax=Vanilla planifolia TaxID=51239 RepID=A0A835QIR0_VANPL|nr:hypothetical protein HPP92_015893 [Vanilla planifolia]
MALSVNSLLLNSQIPNSFSFQNSSVRSKSLQCMASLSISETFARLRKKGKEVAFIPYITAGDPDLRTTSKALKILDSCGSDVIELGMPYSDPSADGPVIQASATRALAQGANFNGIISMLNEVIPHLSCPIALFSYYNPIQKHGVENFMTTIKNVGIHGTSWIELDTGNFVLHPYNVIHFE